MEYLRPMNTLEQLIYPAIDELEPGWAGVSLPRTPDTPLIGPEAALDSLGLVTLIVTIEGRVTDDLGRTVTLASEKAMSRSQSPFRTLGTLAAHLDELLAAAPAD
jgi:acyl carrier protein